MGETRDLGKTSLGMEPNVEALLCYLFGFLTGIVFYVLEKENKFVRFHAMQSIVVFGAVFAGNIVVSFIPFIGLFMGMIVNLAALVLWIILMVKAYQGEMFKLPAAGDFAEKKA